MRVRDGKFRQYRVNMCWLCMPIRVNKTKWSAENFPAEHEHMQVDGEDVVSQVDGQGGPDVKRHTYLVSSERVCKASKHACMGFNCTLEAFRNLKDWLI